MTKTAANSADHDVNFMIDADLGAGRILRRPQPSSPSRVRGNTS
jgi:hypothetical protein